MGEDTECPTCGREDFESNRGMRTHHARTHGESITAVTVECAWCGQSKDVVPHQAEKCDRHFCSRKCEGEWKAANIRGIDHHQFEGEVVFCEWCGEEKAVSPNHYEQQERFFCDHECYGQWRSEERSGEEAHTWRGGEETLECEHCGDSFTTPTARKEIARFCSRSCLSEWRSENVRGQAHPLWKDVPEHPDYGPNWEERRKEILERDDFTCKDCGATQPANSPDFPVHHIVPRREFVDQQGRYDYERGNKPDNLITLCPSCHPKWNHLPGLRPDNRQTAD